MTKKEKQNLDDLAPLNFDESAEKVTGHLKSPAMTREEMRGDNEAEQYYEQEEALSPEEVKLRKKEDELA